ncbi:hypothetical protein N7462_009802 [Penicillium macrosclerotiorum]|uniref:uncharacterized protein n=1 Tax=Penicillium macrosclerotiorum TaxID=303699 RepID=UPI002546DD57|nr:uncharacterized protein N7462_009802 [Penicillium macrosclerotiorum]KAJ5668732.1 hypothetical protein N7462_009802 [Penicillium macrosclerotiorum]
MPMTDETDHSGGVILDGPFDPDAQATVTDYIDYTEYLPADLIRSLTLIRGLDDRYLDSAHSVHSLARTYGQLPDLASDDRPSAISLRREISLQLDRAINARESAYAEACRVYDVVDRHFDRLSCIRQKLDALPRPPSTEPTPPPQPTPKRARPGKKDTSSTTRITLRLDNRKRSSGTQKSRSRRSGLVADHLADFNPDSPIASTEHSDEEAEIELPPKPARPPKKEKARRLSSGVGVSTSNALAMLKPPPDDAKIGSEDLPWLRLTEWEMTKLRKKMKKNAVWQPSEVMIHRELALAGRGWEAYRTAKALADETGAEFVDCDDIETTRRDEMFKDLEETKLSNRGMKLNEAKKLKREMLAREAALHGEETPFKQAAIAAQGTPASRSSRKRKREEIAVEEVAIEEEDVAPEPVQEPAPVPRPSSTRRRSSRGATTNGPAGAPAAPVLLAIETRISPAAEARLSPALPSPTGSRRSTRSAAHPASASTPTPPVTRPSSRRSAAATSELGGLSTIAAAGGRDVRIKSATPARKTPVRELSHAPSVPAPTRRRKRPAPGPVSSGQDGGAAVSYGRRKAKPGKKRISVQNSQDIRVDEDGVLEEIDANEPRYCLCGDVSFGTMICCENQDVSLSHQRLSTGSCFTDFQPPKCDREWFHLECVGLSEVPSRTAKWYCPECRVKFHKGTDGIIKGGSRR